MRHEHLAVGEDDESLRLRGETEIDRALAEVEDAVPGRTAVGCALHARATGHDRGRCVRRGDGARVRRVVTREGLSSIVREVHAIRHARTRVRPLFARRDEIVR